MNLKPRQREEQPEINLISLIDVVLLMVVFFMVSSTFVQEGRIKITLPQASAGAEKPAALNPITVTITAQGAYLVNERTLINNSVDTLRVALQKVAGDAREQTVTIRADARATHQSVVTAMDTIGRLGFAQINILTLHDEK